MLCIHLSKQWTELCSACLETDNGAMAERKDRDSSSVIQTKYFQTLHSPEDLRLPPPFSSAAALAFCILASGSWPQSEMVCCLTMLTWTNQRRGSGSRDQVSTNHNSPRPPSSPPRGTPSGPPARRGSWRPSPCSAPPPGCLNNNITVRHRSSYSIKYKIWCKNEVFYLHHVSAGPSPTYPSIHYIFEKIKE